MGRRGPSPQPTALKIVRGNPGGKPLNKREPKPDHTIPDCPGWLNEEAKAAWARLAPKLAKMHVLTDSDGDALSAYCQVYARWKEAEQFLQVHGSVFEFEIDGQPRSRTRPEAVQAKELLQLMRQFQGEFGLTPSSRSRIVVAAEAGDTDEEFEKFLNG